jgi:hypothetical protein
MPSLSCASSPEGVAGSAAGMGEVRLRRGRLRGGWKLDALEPSL